MGAMADPEGHPHASPAEDDLARVVAAIEARRQANRSPAGAGPAPGASPDRRADDSGRRTPPASAPEGVGAAHQISRLREWRQWKGRETGIRRFVEAVDVRLRRMDGRMLKVSAALESLVGPSIAERLSPLGLSRGVLTLGVDSSSLAYEVDRRMREGGLAELQQRTGLAINRVKVKIVADDQSGRSGPSR